MQLPVTEFAKSSEWEDYREKSENLIAMQDRVEKMHKKRIQELEMKSRAHSGASA